MQTNERGSRRGRFGKLGSFILGALICTASSAWAAPFTGTAQGFFTTNLVFNPDGTFSHTIGTNTLRGYTTLGGAMLCHAAQMRFEFLQEPTGACDAGEFENVSTNHYHCQLEGTEDVFHSIGIGTGCSPSSCFDENMAPQAGCSFTYTESVTAAGGTGIAEGSSGSWTTSGAGTFTQVGQTGGPEGFFTQEQRVNWKGMNSPMGAFRRLVPLEILPWDKRQWDRAGIMVLGWRVGSGIQ